MRVLVIGASGELGCALAREYAGPGVALCLWGRDTARLQAVGALCREKGALVKTRSLDLLDLDAAVTAILDDDDELRFDVGIFGAGLGDILESGRRVEQPEQVLRLTAVNFAAPAALSACLADRMAARGSGNIVLIGSVASFHALPFAIAYTSTKAGLARFADGLRLAIRPYGVRVTLASPGFINTAAARRVPGPKPFILQPDEAARRIVKAAARGKGHVIMPQQFAALRLIDRLLPRFLRDRLLLALAPPE